MSIEESWKKVEAWAAKECPNMLKYLEPPAKNRNVSSLAKTLEVELPSEYVDLLMLHNGEQGCWPSAVFSDYGRLLSAKEVAMSWKRLRSIAKEMYRDYPELAEAESERGDDDDLRVSGAMFESGWIPFIEWNGAFLAIDLSPTEQGLRGQIIEIGWAGSKSKVIAPSLKEFIERYAEDLEAGRYKYRIDGIPTEHDPDAVASEQQEVDTASSQEPRSFFNHRDRTLVLDVPKTTRVGEVFVINALLVKNEEPKKRRSKYDIEIPPINVAPLCLWHDEPVGLIQPVLPITDEVLAQYDGGVPCIASAPGTVLLRAEIKGNTQTGNPTLISEQVSILIE